MTFLIKKNNSYTKLKYDFYQKVRIKLVFIKIPNKSLFLTIKRDLWDPLIYTSKVIICITKNSLLLTIASFCQNQNKVNEFICGL